MKNVSRYQTHYCIFRTTFLTVFDHLKPAVNKVDMACAKSYRPISLLSYLLKTLEKLIYWHISETVLKIYSLSKAQHAFKKNYSTDKALSDLVDKIKSAILNNELALVVNLDIQWC